MLNDNLGPLLLQEREDYFWISPIYSISGQWRGIGEKTILMVGK